MTMFGQGRANRRDFPFDESKFKPGQREAAALLVEYEFTDHKSRKSKEEIAEEAGVSRNTLHLWSTRDRNFIEYKNYLAADFFDSFLPLVYSKMIDGIKNGSMKGIELYLKRMGDLDSRSEVTINDGVENQTYTERKAALLERLKGAADEGDKEDTDDGEGGK